MIDFDFVLLIVVAAFAVLLFAAALKWPHWGRLR
jgi:hypothetical protein